MTALYIFMTLLIAGFLGSVVIKFALFAMHVALGLALLFMIGLILWFLKGSTNR